MPSLENRLPPPVLLAGLAVAMWFAAGLAPPWTTGGAAGPWLAAACTAAGAFVNASGFTALRRAGTTIDPTRPQRASALVTGGVFARTRNPMYLGFALLLLGWALWLRSPWALLGPVVFVAFVDRFQIRPEERALAARFGEAWSGYARTVRRWV